MATSIVEYYGEQLSACGYCKGTKSMKSHGMNAYRMSCGDYQLLIDRGWRRSGEYCYKLRNDVTCCPCYTIKCDAMEFKISKSNKRVLKRMSRFLRDGKRDATDGNGDGDEQLGLKQSIKAEEDHDANFAGELQPEIPEKVVRKIDIEQVASVAHSQRQKHSKQIVHVNQGDSSKATVNKNSEGQGVAQAVPSSSHSLNPPRKKAKQMRLDRRQARLGGLETKLVEKKKINLEKSLQDYLKTSDTDKHKLKLEKSSDGPEMGYGSFHQQYWVDDKLIAVGVIDVLPSSVSSVYFFYDPDYSFLSLGTYGSLREIEFVQKLADYVPNLRYYYMGFYIHTCPKMRYKCKLSPSYLLCPETYVWFPFTEAIGAKLDVCEYQRLNPDPTAAETDLFNENHHLDDVAVLINPRTCTTYRDFRHLHFARSERDRRLIIEYSKLVGKVCAHRIILINTCNN